MAEKLLELRDLSIEFGSVDNPMVAVNKASFSIDRGETAVLVGESGSGKSISALAILRLLPHAARITSGEILLRGNDVLSLSEKQMRDAWFTHEHLKDHVTRTEVLNVDRSSSSATDN